MKKKKSRDEAQFEPSLGSVKLKGRQREVVIKKGSFRGKK